VTRTPARDRDRDDLAARWEQQQERYLPHREERFGIMLDVVARRTDGSDLRLLDLCCGTGSISRRVLAHFPSAAILAVDMDPAHLELGRRALGDRVEWRDADLRDQAWADDLPAGSFDSVLSATAIHWFQPEEIISMYRTLAGLLRVGGVFSNADHMPVSSSPIAALSEELLDEWQTAQLRDAEDYYAYRDALRADPELRSEVEEGDRRFADKPTGVAAPLSFHREALMAAGFATADEVWRHHADAILVAIR
jgi:trans-aconitate methyltransferase